MESIPGPWRAAYPVVGNLLECLRPDFHKVLLKWADDYGGVVRIKFLWKDALIVTDPQVCLLLYMCGDCSCRYLELCVCILGCVYPRGARRRALRGCACGAQERCARTWQRPSAGECAACLPVCLAPSRAACPPPQALAAIMGRGEGALDKAAGVYQTINYM